MFGDCYKKQPVLFQEVSARTNCFVIKSSFQITRLLMKKNWAHTYNFKSAVELVSTCGGEEIKKTLLIYNTTLFICHLNTLLNTLK